MEARAHWMDVNDGLPEEKEPVTIRVHDAERTDYYRIEDRWYSLDDLDRWQMNTSRYWAEDRSWYLKTAQIERWKGSDEHGASTEDEHRQDT